MHILNQIKNDISPSVKIIAITKGRDPEAIEDLIKLNHFNFGENRFQEAIAKWPPLIMKYPDIKLHYIGKLQSKKIKELLDLFDVIETVDSFEIAEKIAISLQQINKKIELFIQVNIGNEPQKGGISLEELQNLYLYCKNLKFLNVVGLMCIPPKDHDPLPYFLKLKALAEELELSQVSMGMSSDYKIAIDCGATQIRLGRILFA